MAQSIRDTICSINEQIERVFRGAKCYGVATIIEREGKARPVYDEKDISFDDSFAMQVYHRLGNIVVSSTPGYGDSDNTVNTFSVSAIVFNNEKLTRLKNDEVAMILQSLLANINISATITPANIILNTQAIYATEYRGQDFRLSESLSLMQFNYTVGISFKSGCFDLCPEDFSQCKK